MPDGGRRAAVLTALSVVAWAVHAVDIVARGEPWDLLWMCNLGGLVLAAGLGARSPRVVAVAACWFALGVPLWALDLLAGGEVRVSSVASHLGGAALAAVGVRWLGWPRRTTVPAVASLAALVLLCRLVTPASANVNLVWEVWPGWEDDFGGHAVYLAFLAGLGTAAFAVVDAAASRWVRPPAR